MQAKGIVVDVDGYGHDRIAADLTEHELMQGFQVVASDQLEAALQPGEAAVLIVIASSWNDQLSLLLADYSRLFGPISRFMAIVCDQPSPALMSGAFEFGVDQFIVTKAWPKAAEGLLRKAGLILSESVSEMHTIRVNQAIRCSSQGQLQLLHTELKPFMGYDYLAAYTMARASEALGNFEVAAGAYQLSRSIYPYFRPAISGLIENLLILGKMNDAWPLLNQMEVWFDQEVGRKALLVSAALSAGDHQRAKDYLGAAVAFSKTHPRVIEAQVQLLLAERNLTEALRLLDSVSDAGALFASRLNEVGIELSKNKRGSNALSLYEKAHRIVRPELKYKISLNAALAAHRAGDYSLALRYANQAEEEFGGSFPKLVKIRGAVEKRLKGGPHVA